MTFRLGAGALILAVASSSCIPRTLEQLETQTKSSCDGSRPCAAGWHCGSDGFCAPDVAGACDEGATMPCGMSGGECRMGTITCSGGKWGACMGSVGPVQEVCDGNDNDCNGTNDDNAIDAPRCPLADAGVCLDKHGPCGGAACGATTYGPDYELTETKCDGKDNDCNGTADQGLTQMCPEQRGECSGAVVTCSGGGFPACNAAIYSANNPAYRSYEMQCDNKDNDCDGLTDAWAPSNVSQSALRSRNAAAGVSSSSPNDVVLIWEEEDGGATRGIFKVKARVVHEDNSMTGVVPPSSTASAAFRSWAPSIASDGPDLVAAWAEEVTNGGAKRIALVSLDPNTGQSNLSGMGAFAPLSGNTEVTQPNEVAVALDSTGGRAFIAIIDGSALKYASAIWPLSAATAQYKRISEGITGVSHVRVSPAGNKNFWLSWETATGTVQRCLVDDNGNRNCASMTPTGKFPTIAGLNAAPPYSGLSFFLQDISPGNQRVFSSGCSDGGTCVAATPVSAIPTTTNMSALSIARVSRFALPTFFTWEEGFSTSANVRYLVSSGDAGVQPAGQNVGHRPTPVFIGGNRGAVVFDTDMTTGSLTADEIYVSRFCY